MESMSQAPYLLPQARFGFRMGDAKALDAMVHDGLTNPFSGKQMFVEATEVGDELEITRPDLDRWALRSHERALAATDDGRLTDEIVSVTVKGRKGDTVVEVDEAPAPRVLARGARQAPRPDRQGGLAHRRQLAGRQRRRGRARARLATSGRRPTARRSSPRSSARRRSADDFAYLARTPASARSEGARQAGLTADDIDLWEINEAFASVTLQLDPDARHRRGQGQRQRRRGRPRPPDRRLRRAHHRRARARAAPPRRRARLRGDLLAAAARATPSS